MKSIFLSYRRAESADIVDRMFEHLSVQFGRDRIFKDLDSIPLGEDFRENIQRAIQSSGALVTVIGPHWLHFEDDRGRRRIEDPDDYVRLELEVALKSGVPVIPVLVGGARVPLPQELPESLRPLAFRQGSSVRSDPDFASDIARLGRALGDYIGSRDSSTFRPLWRRWVVASGCAVLIVAAGFAFLLTRPLPPPKVLGSVQVTHDGRLKFITADVMGGMVTDGPRIYFTEPLDGVLAQVPASGGETVIIPTSYHDLVILDISPVRSDLLVVEWQPIDSQLTVLQVPAGSARRLGDVKAHDGTWSPDGQRIVYARGSELYVARSDGSDSQKLASLPGEAAMPRWSPDGARLRFTLYDPTTTSTALWEVLADGSKLHPLLPGWNSPPAECCGNWTRDGKYFVFQSQRNGRYDIWAWRENGGLLRKATRQPVRLTAGPTDTVAPLPSKDGKKLFVIGEQPRGELTRYDSKSGQFAPYLSGISAEGVDFSKDGKWVVYVAYPEGTLWRSHVDASERLQLTYPPMSAGGPQWAPDGKRIAFCGFETGRPPKIYIVLFDGGIPQPATEERSKCDPAWAPDGNSLAFSGVSGVKGFSTAIQVLDFQSQRVTTLPGSDGLLNPLWSPDGHYIVAQSGEKQSVFLFDAKSKEWAELVGLPAGWCKWSRDGKFVYFDVPSTNEPAIYRVRVADRKVERLVSLKGYRRAWGFAGRWMGLAPDDSPLLLHDIGIQEIYALDVDLP